MLANIQKLSTTAVPPPERLAFWNDVCMGAYGVRVVDTEPDGFQAALTSLSAGQLQISSVKSTAGVSRTTNGRTKSRGPTEVFSLQIVHSGQGLLRHAGTETLILPGDMVIADPDKSYELSFVEPIQGLVVSLPWSGFELHAEALEALAGRRIHVSSGPGAVLSNFIRSSWEQLVEGGEGAWPDSAGEVIWDLVASVLPGEVGRETAAGRPDCLRREASALIHRRLSDSDFQSAQIAPTLGVSARYLQVVFAEVGTTPSHFLLARRLEAAAAQLRCLDRASHITDIALECGFNDLSYFSRTFRRRFGVSARVYRMTFGARPTDWH